EGGPAPSVQAPRSAGAAAGPHLPNPGNPGGRTPMTQTEAHAWWSRLRHQGLLLSPVVMLERYSSAPTPAPFHQTGKLRDACTRFNSAGETRKELPEQDTAATLAWVDALLEGYLGHRQGRLARQHAIPEKLTAVVRIGSRTETIRPHRVVFADPDGK